MSCVTPATRHFHGLDVPTCLSYVTGARRDGVSRSELEPLPQPVLPGGRGAQRETQRASSVSSTSGHLKASLPLPLEPGGPPKATVPAHAPQLRFHFSPGLPNRLTPVPTQSQQVMSPLAVGQQGPPPGLCPRLAFRVCSRHLVTCAFRPDWWRKCSSSCWAPSLCPALALLLPPVTMVPWLVPFPSISPSAGPSAVASKQTLVSHPIK